MERLRKRLREVMAEKDFTVMELAEKAQIPESTLQSIIYRKGEDCKLSTITKLADSLNCTIDELIDRHTISEEERYIIYTLRQLPPRSTELAKFVINLERKLSYANTKDGTCKIPIYVLTSNTIDGFPYDSQYFENYDISNYPDRIKEASNFGVKVNTHSMKPAYLYGDILLISTDRYPNNGENGLYMDGKNNFYIRKRTWQSLEPISGIGRKIYFPEAESLSCLGYVISLVRDSPGEEHHQGH